MEILFEILLEIYMELMVLIVPREKVSNKMQVVAGICAVLVLLGVLIAFIIGVGLISEGNKLKGWILVSLATVISLAQIIAGIILYFKRTDD